MEVKMFKGIIGMLLVGTLMTGCIEGFSLKSTTTDADVQATQAITLAQSDCYKSDKIERGDMSAAEYGLLLANQAMRDMYLGSIGKPKCAVTTVYESQIAEVESKTGMVNGVVGAVSSVATNGIIGASVVGLVGNSGNRYNTTGLGADIVVADKSNNDPSFDSYNTATQTSAVTTTVPVE